MRTRIILDAKPQFCSKSSNCVAGNTLARKSLDILENLKNGLEFVLEEGENEYAVYSALLQEWYHDGIGYEDGKPGRGPVQLYVISDDTSINYRGTDPLSETLEYVRREMSQPLDQEVIDDFLKKNAQSYPLNYSFELPATVILTSKTELREIFAKGYDYFELSARYPFSPGIMTVSRVGFNAQRDQALFYVDSRESYDCGAGFYILLVKENNVWRIKGSIWVS